MREVDDAFDDRVLERDLPQVEGLAAIRLRAVCVVGSRGGDDDRANEISSQRCPSAVDRRIRAARSPGGQGEESGRLCCGELVADKARDRSFEARRARGAHDRFNPERRVFDETACRTSS